LHAYAIHTNNALFHTLGVRNASRVNAGFRQVAPETSHITTTFVEAILFGRGALTSSWCSDDLGQAFDLCHIADSCALGEDALHCSSATTQKQS